MGHTFSSSDRELKSAPTFWSAPSVWARGRKIVARGPGLMWCGRCWDRLRLLFMEYSGLIAMACVSASSSGMLRPRKSVLWAPAFRLVSSSVCGIVFFELGLLPNLHLLRHITWRHIFRVPDMLASGAGGLKIVGGLKWYGWFWYLSRAVGGREASISSCCSVSSSVWER